MSQYTAEDVKNILTTFAEEFLVDIPARHENGDYLIDAAVLERELVLGEPMWYEAIAGTVNENISLYNFGLL